jgi:hypothetical protein
VRKLVRPTIHSDFESTVAPVRDAVESSVKANQSPDFPADWSAFKMEFTRAQNGKCGFCEGPVLGLHYGDVEHFRPKSEVSELYENNPDSWGREEVWKSTVVGRTLKPNPTKPGYWWRAYDWHNYLLSCQICNQQWKGSLFPVVANRRVLDPKDKTKEQPLLLSPFEDIEPAEHFEYGRLGEIRGLSNKGRATILTCGLDRPSLRLARYRTAKAVHEHLDEIAENITEFEMLQLLRYIEDAGAELQPYCGMVQTIFRARTSMAWEDLSQLIATLAGRGSLNRHLCDC